VDHRVRHDLHHLIGRLGNPLKSEGAAFRWLIAVIAGAVVVILAAVLVSSVAGAIIGFLLIAAVSVAIARGMIHMLGSPDGDETADRRADAPEQTPSEGSPYEEPPRG
jgi:hypothetical protein